MANDVIGNIFEKTQEGIIITDSDDVILNVNPAFTKITGFEYEEAIGKKPADLLESGYHSKEFFEDFYKELMEKGEAIREIRNKKKDGTVFPERVSVSVIKDDSGRIQNYLTIFSDISEYRKKIDTLEYIANMDALTGLPNRNAFRHELTSSIKESVRYGYMGAVMFLDLDNFKSINDSLGHDVGDQLLIKMGERVRSCVRETDVVSRLGGDEFTVILKKIDEIASATLVAQNILNVLTKEPFILVDTRGKEVKLVITASIGIAIYPNDGESYESILNAADEAMYAAKSSGKNKYGLYNTFNNSDIKKKYIIDNDLREGIKNMELDFELLPYFSKSKIDKEDYNIEEACFYNIRVKYEHPKFGVIDYEKYLIKFVEDNRLFLELYTNLFNKLGLNKKVKPKKGIKIVIYLPEYIFKQTNYLEQIKEIQRMGGLKNENIILKINTPMIIRNYDEAPNKINNLKDLGYDIMLGDFGTGRLSLREIYMLGFTYINFGEGILDDKGILNLTAMSTKYLNAIIVISNISDEETLELVKAIDYDCAEGDAICSSLKKRNVLFSKSLLIE